PQPHAFFDEGHGQAAGAGFESRLGDGDVTVAIGVGLDDGTELGRSDEPGDRPHAVADRAQVAFGMGGAHPDMLAPRTAPDDHAAMAGGSLEPRPLGESGLEVTALGLGLAALGRPAYINLGREVGEAPSVAEMRDLTHAMLDAAYDTGIRYV